MPNPVVRPSSASNGEPLLAIRQLSKQFGGAQALSNVDFELMHGEIHGLVGANGAGKSTLIRVIAGVVRPDAGEIRVDGRPVSIRGPLGAASFGFHFIHQELNLVPKFSARQNMVLGLRKPKRLAVINWRAVEGTLRPIAERLGIDFPLDTPVERLSIANRWLVSIGRALVDSARLVAMDEPTASLSATEVERLFRIIGDLRDEGVAVLYVSHRLAEIQQLCDRATVFKDGQRVATVERGDLTRAALVEAIVGSRADSPSSSPTLKPTADAGHQPGPAVLEVHRLSRPPLVRDVSFTLHRGELLGLAGLVGAGRTETARAVFGADRLTGGSLKLDGRVFRPRSTPDSVKRGLALVPEERRSQGLILQKNVRFNLSLVSLRQLRILRWFPALSMRRLDRQARDIVAKLSIRPERTDTVVSRLSGGNQQKVVIGKWLARRSSVLILDEPTRGVDVSARAEIHRVMRELADSGMGVLVIASEFAELLDCDRVLVMDRGAIVGELRGGDITEQAILRLCYIEDEATA